MKVTFHTNGDGEVTECNISVHGAESKRVLSLVSGLAQDPSDYGLSDKDEVKIVQKWRERVIKAYTTRDGEYAKIQTIKTLREQTGAGLREAKGAVEAFEVGIRHNGGSF